MDGLCVRGGPRELRADVRLGGARELPGPTQPEAARPRPTGDRRVDRPAAPHELLRRGSPRSGEGGGRRGNSQR